MRDTPEPDDAGARIHVGTSGYSFKDWVGPFYPPGTKPAEQLQFYASRFRCLEVNVSYYRVPDAKLFESMCARTPDDFEFIVKLHGDVTHKRSADAALYASFRESLKPLQERGRFHGLLAQFPYSFKNTQPNRAFLVELRQRFPEAPLFTEFRHDGWMLEPVFAFLVQQRIGYVSVDEPDLQGLVPPLARATTDVGYVRLHGRNAENWYASAPGRDRYDYLYSDAELRAWAAKVRELVRETRKTYVFFNNCHAGAAPANAVALQRILGLLPS